MSLLSRFIHAGHLDDAALGEIWSAAVAEGRTATHPHLKSCATCRVRYSALTTWLAEIRAEAHAEADEVFPPERLAAQHAQIFRRLEALERPARVIAFPRFSRPASARSAGPQRWIAAAAAGVVIGLAAGQIVDLRQALERPQSFFQGDSRLGPQAQSNWPPGVQPAGITDEDLFYDADARSSTAGILPIDAMTPRSRDFEYPR